MELNLKSSDSYILILSKKCFNVWFFHDFQLRSSPISYNFAISLFSDLRSCLPILCRTLILLFDGDANIILCNLRIEIPVLKVPYDAIMIAFSSCSVMCLISSRTSTSVPPWTKNIFLPSSAFSFIILCRVFPCFSTY